MNGGVIGVPVDTATHVEIEGVEDWTGSSHGEHGTELDAALSVKEVRTLSGDTDYYVGEAFKQREEEFDATTGGGSTGSPDASKLTAWGNDVLDDPDVGKLLSGAVRSNVLNQVAGRYVWDGIPLYLTLAKSGYAEVWNPSDMDTSEFLGWISAEVVPVADAPTEDEETEQDTLGDEGAEGSA